MVVIHFSMTLKLWFCSQQGGAQISLAEICRSGEKSTRWYNLLSYKYLQKQNRKSKQGSIHSEVPCTEKTVRTTLLASNRSLLNGTDERVYVAEGLLQQTRSEGWRVYI